MTALSREKEELLKYYNLGLSAYKQRKWDDAIRAFEMALKLYPEDHPSEIYLERSKAFKETPPPEDWDGVLTMTEK
jgi:adenylate cyclase